MGENVTLSCFELILSIIGHMIVKIWEKWAKFTKTSKKGPRYWKLYGARCVSQIHGTKLLNMVYCVDILVISRHVLIFELF